MGAKYLNDQHFKIPDDVAKFINTTILKNRFYSNDKPKNKKQNKTKNNKKLPEKKELTQEERGKLEYLMKQMDIISKWENPNNEQLFYHIKQVIFFTNSMQFLFEGVLSELPWRQFIFYLQQYIKYFTSRDEIHLYQIGLISQEILTNIIEVFRQYLEKVKNQTKLSKIMLGEEHTDKIKYFKEIYHEIRDVYVLYRICHYVESYPKGNVLIILRILQVIGECLKETDKTTNASEDLIKCIKKYILPPEHVDILYEFRETISHLTSIPDKMIDKIFIENYINKIANTFYGIKLNFIYKKYEGIKQFIKDSNKIGDLPNFYKVTHKNLIDEILSQRPPELCEEEVDIKKLKDDIPDSSMTEYKDLLKSLRESQTPTDCYMEMELKLMIILENLWEQKRLNNNFEWFQEMYPTLTGRKLRNHLAHGDPIVDLLGLNEEMAVRDTAKLLTGEIDISDPSELVIEKITKVLKGDQLKEIDKIQLNKIKAMENLFERIIDGDLELVKKLLYYIQNKWVDWRDKNGHNVLEMTAQNKKDNVYLFDFILKKNPNFINDINKYGNSIFQIANMAGNTNITKYILEKIIMANLNKFVNELCIRTDTIEPQQQNVWKIIAYYVICLNDEKALNQIIKLFYYNVPDFQLDNNLNTYLHIACIHGAEKVVQYLIKIGSNLNCLNIHKDTPLSLAIQHKRDNIIQLLLNKGATGFKVNNITESNKILFNAQNGRNCLHFAVESNNPDMVQRIYDVFPHLLVTYDLQLITPLNLVISNNNETLLKYILYLVFIEYSGKDNVQSELFKHVVKTLMKTSNDKIAEVVLNKVLQVMNMNSKDKIFNYWIINLVNHYFKTINEYGTDKVEGCLNLVKNGIENFTEEQIIEQCLLLFVNIFINNSQWEKNDISATLNFFLKEAKNCNKLFSLEKLNNQFDSANFGNIADFKYELMSEHIVLAMENDKSDADIQYYAFKLLNLLIDNNKHPDIDQSLIRKSLLNLISAYSNDDYAISLCAKVYAEYYITSPQITLQNIDGTIKSKLEQLDIETRFEDKLRYYMMSID
ncbi:uncharacterized protein [Atheta coriaria]|uniref:uncharacterized protein n=1 Tax=Dalotia coriaria TaxID=877792 RepID=UPI0031F40E8A